MQGVSRQLCRQWFRDHCGQAYIDATKNARGFDATVHCVQLL
jgi:hypothetical protein